MTDPQQLWMLVGGNGAGKSTFFRLYLESKGIQFINADNIAKTLGHENQERLAYQAAKVAGQIREDFLLKGLSFCFETVFSHPSKIDFMADAKARGYEVILVFIHLDGDQLNQARVEQRVNEGGHNVPTEKIISRIPRTLNHVRQALPLADAAYILDNSLRDDPYQQVAVLKDGRIMLLKKPLPRWAEEVLIDYLADYCS
ncbi:MAG: AAA family ATPase [Sedimenticola sp.]